MALNMNTFNKEITDEIKSKIDEFIVWLEGFGEYSFDHQSYFAGPIGGRAKRLYYSKPALGILAVAPMIFSEAFVPAARRLFWKKLRFPIADAHYAMGFAYLYQAVKIEKYYDMAVHFLDELIDSRSPGYQNYCWGYPFNWVTRNGTYPANTPFITSTPYMYEAFASVYQIDKEQKWLNIMHSIAEHALHDIKDFPTGPDAASCTYSPLPGETGGVINASAYRALLLNSAFRDFNKPEYRDTAMNNLNFVISSQQVNGAWYYAMDDVRDFVDHYHTCFVLKALVKTQQMTGDDRFDECINKGVEYYTNNLFDDDHLPKPFSKPPRLTVYKKELYDYAECINIGVLLRGRFSGLDQRIDRVLDDLMTRWHKTDGSFRSRELTLGWDNVPMHRWAQAQMFRSLSFLLLTEKD
jgi:hypothetical protein